METRYIHKALLSEFGSLANAAEYLNIDRTHLSKMMHGHYKVPKKTENKIYKILGKRPSNTVGLFDDQIEWNIVQSKE